MLGALISDIRESRLLIDIKRDNLSYLLSYFSLGTAHTGVRCLPIPRPLSESRGHVRLFAT